MDFDWQQVWDKAKDFGIDYGPAVMKAVAVFIIGRWVAKIIVKVLRRVMKRANVDSTLSSFLGNLAYMALLTFIVIAAMGELGVETNSFVAIIGAAGIAIGFALQGSLANFAAGVMLIIFRPFEAGDFIEAAGVSGVVEEILVFATRIRTGDNKTIIVPNSSVTGGNIINYSAKETRRVDLVFGIGYDDDIRAAKKTLEEILAADDRVLAEPKPMIAVAELADSSVNIACRPWVKTADYWGVFFDTTETVKLEFDKRGISIPFPQRDVHMISADGGMPEKEREAAS